MISAGDFRNGITLEIDGNVYQIMEFQHVKPGKGAAFFGLPLIIRENKYNKWPDSSILKRIE